MNVLVAYLSSMHHPLLLQTKLKHQKKRKSSSWDELALMEGCSLVKVVANLLNHYSGNVII